MNWYYAFHLNEYKYKTLYFTRHKKRETAEKFHYVPYRGSCYTDYETTIIQGKEALEKWANENYYKIDWENKVLLFDEAAWRSS